MITGGKTKTKTKNPHDVQSYCIKVPDASQHDFFFKSHTYLIKKLMTEHNNGRSEEYHSICEYIYLPIHSITPEKCLKDVISYITFQSCSVLHLQIPCVYYHEESPEHHFFLTRK